MKGHKLIQCNCLTTAVFKNIRCTITGYVLTVGIFSFLMMGTGALASGQIQSQTMDEMVVTGSSMPRALELVSQSISIISKEEIAALPVINIAGLLETVGGVDIRQRGGSGVQADVSIRGGSFEQTLILVDGFNVSDGQTGHHNMNLPINLSDIERIEIIKGPGARVYGHNAMAGVINIITKEPDQKQVHGEIQVGEDDSYGVGADFSGNIYGLSNRLSASRKASSGYLSTEETDFDIKTVNYRGGLYGKNYDLKMGMNYTKNDLALINFTATPIPTNGKLRRPIWFT